MEVVEKGETLEEWFLTNIHTCHRCKTKFRAGKKAKLDRDYELEECTSTRGYVKVDCPHCKVTLFLYAPVDPLPVTPSIPYVPVPYPVYPNPWQPWLVNPFWYGVSGGVYVGDTVPDTITVPQMTEGAFGVVTAQVCNSVDTVVALNVDVTGVKELRTHPTSIFGIVQ